MIHIFNLLMFFMHIIMNRINPYPPNFRRTAARIIDPSIGASTCAFGSHKCVKYIGIFTKNAIIKSKIILNFVKNVLEKINDGFFNINTILIKRGNDAEIVYSIK